MLPPMSAGSSSLPGGPFAKRLLLLVLFSLAVVEGSIVVSVVTFVFMLVVVEVVGGTTDVVVNIVMVVCALTTIETNTRYKHIITVQSTIGFIRFVEEEDGMNTFFFFSR